ncbi:hypothetical protein B0H13DRAFT_2011208 [Mycena leptocephala]|nr:hypothetical protein B0H13DRAFT_2011208 [Mycena leptocephala]
MCLLVLIQPLLLQQLGRGHCPEASSTASAGSSASVCATYASIFRIACVSFSFCLVCSHELLMRLLRVRCLP